MAAASGPEANGNTATGEDDIAKRVPPDTVLPPRGQRDLIEKVASYVARNGTSFEEKVRKNNSGTSAVAYLEPDHPYHDYYQWRVAENKAGRGLEANKNITRNTDVSFAPKPVYVPPQPPDFKFSARMPTISAQDLDIVKLTALFAAKNGRSWITGLSQKEAGNYQFDFLRPQHSLNMYFTRLMEQYKELLDGETVENGAPQKKRIGELEEHVRNRFHILDGAKQRAEYHKYLEKQKVDKEEKAEADRVAFAQIDWHDFSVVATITFDERDEAAEMPPPKTLNDMLSLSLEQKAKMTVDPSRRLEESIPTFDDYNDFYGQQQQFPAAQVVPPPVSATPPQQSAYPPPAATPSLQEERERARAAAKQVNNQQARVRTDYVPQAQLRKQQQNTSICSICKQAIPNEEMEQHMRIEMLSPEWREQMVKNQQRSSTTNLSTADVANNLKRLASQRADLFDSVTGNPISEEEQSRRKRAELQAYDGVSQVPNPAALGAMGQQPPGVQYPPGTERPNVEDQIRYLHDKYKK